MARVLYAAKYVLGVKNAKSASRQRPRRSTKPTRYTQNKALVGFQYQEGLHDMTDLDFQAQMLKFQRSMVDFQQQSFTFQNRVLDELDRLRHDVDTIRTDVDTMRTDLDASRQELTAEVKQWDKRFYELSRDTANRANTLIASAAITVIAGTLLT